MQTVYRQQPVTHLYFHLITNLTRCDLNGYIHKMAEQFPHSTIVYSGSIMEEVVNVPANVSRLLTTDDILAFAQK